MENGAGQRLQRLLGFLERDPQNLSLLADTASAALDAGQLDESWRLIECYAEMSPLPAALQNLKGVVAISRQDFGEAVAIFEQLLAAHPADPALRFNLAWARAMLEDYQGALSVLDDEAAAATPAAASLKIQMMHHLGLLEEALACGLGLAELHPDNTALMGALATVAMDAEDLELARLYASRAGDQHEGVAALGMLMLNEEKIDDALGHFNKALESRPDSARALLGKGLALLAKGEPRLAAGWIDKGAEVFGDHLGSWVASGWAYFVDGDLAASRARFETALALDDTFAETHGALAVLDIAEGQIESAKHRTEIALRLDRQCFGAALAKSLLLMSEGNAAAAERVRNIALNTPIGAGGKTIAQAMANMSALGRGKQTKS